MLLAELKAELQGLLEDEFPGSGDIECDVLLRYVLQVSSSELILRYPLPVKKRHQTKLRQLVQRRLNYEPLDYIVKTSEFLGQVFHVKPGVLIPRDETEGLVVQGIAHIKSLLLETIEDNFLGFECGYGSGIISILLGKSFPQSQWHAYDISKTAYRLAQKNAAVHGVKNVNFVYGDFFEKVKSFYRKRKPVIVVSNPPYIKSGDIGALDESVVNHEPLEALDGGESGVEFYERLFGEMRFKACFVLVELGYLQADEVVMIAEKNGYKKVSIYDDLKGIERVGVFKRGM